MDFLQTLLLENPVWLGICSFLLFAIALFARRKVSPPKDRFILPGILGLIAVLFLIQTFFVTEREILQDKISDVAVAFEKKNTLAIIQFIDNGFDSNGMDREHFAKYVDVLFKSLSIHDVRFIRRDITFHEAEAETLLTARATVSIGGGVGDFHWGTWNLLWRKDGASWKIVRITPRVLDGVPMENLQQLRGYVPGGE